MKSSGLAWYFSSEACSHKQCARNLPGNRVVVEMTHGAIVDTVALVVVRGAVEPADPVAARSSNGGVGDQIWGTEQEGCAGGTAVLLAVAAPRPGARQG